MGPQPMGFPSSSLLFPLSIPDPTFSTLCDAHSQHSPKRLDLRMRPARPLGGGCVLPHFTSVLAIYRHHISEQLQGIPDIGRLLLNSVGPQWSHPMGVNRQHPLWDCLGCFEDSLGSQQSHPMKSTLWKLSLEWQSKNPCGESRYL